MVFTLEFEEKGFCAPQKIVYAPPPQSHYSGAGPARHLHFFEKKVMLTFVTLHQKQTKKIYEVQT